MKNRENRKTYEKLMKNLKSREKGWQKSEKSTKNLKIVENQNKYLKNPEKWQEKWIKVVIIPKN